MMSQRPLPLAPPPSPPTAFDQVDPAVAREHPEKVGKPDGVPHDIVGILAFGIVLVAMAMLGGYLLGGLWPALVIATLAAVVLIPRLVRRAGRERTEESRDPSTGPGPS